MKLADFTTVELQRIARAVLRHYLEVEAGMEPAIALSRFLAPAVAAQLTAGANRERPSAGLGHADLGALSILRLSSSRAYAVTARARSGRDGAVALSVELEVRGDKLAAVRVGEADPRALSTEVRDDRTSVGPGQPLPEPPRHLMGLLGELPTDAQPAERWLEAAAVIDTYRERYGIDNGSSAFGPAPTDPEQRQERDRGLTYVRQVAQELEELAPSRERGVERDRSPGRDDLGR